MIREIIKFTHGEIHPNNPSPPTSIFSWLKKILKIVEFKKTKYPRIKVSMGPTHSPLQTLHKYGESSMVYTGKYLSIHEVSKYLHFSTRYISLVHHNDSHESYSCTEADITNLVNEKKKFRSHYEYHHFTFLHLPEAAKVIPG